MEKGAVAWPNPEDVDGLKAVFDAKLAYSADGQLDLFAGN
jgi:hypothetical protein